MVDASTVAALIWLMRYSTKSTRRFVFVMTGPPDLSRAKRFVMTGPTGG
jgi:hypothetical protein